MASVVEYLRVPGRVVLGPFTSLSADPAEYPWAGTELGKLAAAAFDPEISSEPVPHLEHGGSVDRIQLIGAGVLSCVFSGWDDDLVTTLFPNTATTGSGKKRVSGRGSVRHGRLRSGAAVELLFAPDDLASHRALYIPRALPLLAATQQLVLMGGTRWGFPALFEAVEDDSGGTWHLDLVADLVADGVWS